ncbi:MAG: hypothetical protein IK018_06350 [Lachnospiraceae bacterium]|nr:hypothetical protein [Lachnospiraceae bacterium]MBR5993407.1 hypothetical protein [Lachnospiraceae bacterium]
MSLEISSVTQGASVAQTAATSTVSKATEVKEEKAVETVKEDVGAVYEKGQNQGKATYSINKMSKEDRDALVNQLNADMEKRQAQLLDLVQKTISGQVGAYGKATGDDMWKFLASGKFTVDSATKAQAQADISEDGYWGVKQTSQRLFDFASALAGDDVEKMKSMQEAIEKGYKQAEKTWGKELPEISKNTLDATNKLFEDYFASKQ